MSKKIKVGIVGARGFTGGELLRLLIGHPQVEILSAISQSYSGKVSSTHDDLIGLTELQFSKQLKGHEDVVFLCAGHGNSKKALSTILKSFEGKIIDLSNDFRLNQNAQTDMGKFVYGLPEIHREQIRGSKLIANPGCFATAIQLALLPLAVEGLLQSDIHISAITGSTGAGAALQPTTHFSWRNQNVSPYKTFTHQHLDEIQQSLHELQPSSGSELYFLPYRGNFTRGILATAYTTYHDSLDHARSLYSKFYAQHPFVEVVDSPIHLKQVVNTNRCLLHLEKQKGKIIIHSIIDNLVKGASGQAIQNMNLMFGLPETTGLLLKAGYF